MGKAKKRIHTKGDVAEQILGILHGRQKSRLERLLGAVVLMSDGGHFKKELKLFYNYVEVLHAEKGFEGHGKVWGEIAERGFINA